MGPLNLPFWAGPPICGGGKYPFALGSICTGKPFGGWAICTCGNDFTSDCFTSWAAL
jgi:hypothetical protein